MIYGIGTDILAVARLRNALDAGGESFLRGTYTEQERTLIESRPVPLYSYATRFAGKEAVFKALKMPADALRLTDIEILQEPSEEPRVCLHGKALDHANQFGIQKVHISLSFDQEYATAFAVTETE